MAQRLAHSPDTGAVLGSNPSEPTNLSFLPVGLRPAELSDGYAILVREPRQRQIISRGFLYPQLAEESS